MINGKKGLPTTCTGSKSSKPSKKQIKKSHSQPEKTDLPLGDKSDKTIPNADLVFQVIDWNSYHEVDDEDEQSYVIQLYGRTEDDHDVCLKVTNYTPFFYVKVPENWNTYQVNYFVKTLKSKVSWSSTNNPNYDYDLGPSLIRHKLVQKYDFYNFNNKRLFNFVMLVFKSHTAMREYSNVLSRPLRVNDLTPEPMIYDRYGSNLEPHISFMHNRNLSSCGWIKVDGTKLTHRPDYSHCDLSYEVNWKHVCPAGENTKTAPFKIMGYDIECISCDHNFPQANRKTDQIIQIGVTMYRYGSMQCYEEHMLTLKQCAKMDGVTLECYETEKALLRGFARKITELRPDFMAGYNNFGFDDNYIHDRILRLDKASAARRGISVENLENRFSTEICNIMGKLNNRTMLDVEKIPKSLTQFEIKNLSSSALGDNELKFFHIPGIVCMDMMKIIQRDHRLTGYKLDNVSANFITEKAKKIIEGNVVKNKDKSKSYEISIHTGSTKALDIGAYIQIMVDDGYSSSPLIENAKYVVNDIVDMEEKKGEDIIKYKCIKTIIHHKDLEALHEVLENPLLKIFWTFAKDDMHHTLINKYFKQENTKKIRQVARYCLKDCKLVNLLLAKLEVIINSIGMAKVCHVPFSYLIYRGQGVKIFSLVSKKCRQENYLIPVLRKKKTDISGDDDESYEGAVVITPVPGVYLSPIGVLDFNSLYPNSMRERNLSPEMYVTKKRYNNLPGYKYHDIYIIKKDKKGRVMKNIDGTKVTEHHRFAEEIAKEGEPRKTGILPQILTELLDSRKATNALLGKEKDPSIKIALNGLQLAYKITANSLYGQTGAPTSPIYFLPIAASTTSIGRERLFGAKDVVEQNFPGAEIIYGDSVMGDTPLILRDVHGDICIMAIEKLGDTWKSYDQFKPLDTNRKEKQQASTVYQIWTERGWASIKRVIRHKTVKKIYRVVTPSGSVDVTEDHSLLDHNKKIIKPTECKIGTKLLHGFMEPHNVYNTMTVDDAYTLGCNSKNVPGDILNGSLIIKKTYLDGYFSQHKVASDKVTAQSIYYLLKSIGQNDCPEHPYAITKIELIIDNFDGYVYDLETETGTFHAGIGEIIVKNTDSIFINFGLKNDDGTPATDNKALLRTIQCAKEAAALINKSVPSPQWIVYEKTLHPFILVAKKKYIGVLYEQDDSKCSIKAMGLVLKRRDNSPIVKIVVGGIIDHIIKYRNVEKALEYADEIIEKLMSGKYPMDKFVLSKTLRGHYKKPSSIAHKVLADRIALRDPGNKPQINDRIQYVFVVTNMIGKKKKNILQGDLIETPEFVVQNGIEIDYLYYLEHQIMNPASQILELMMPQKKVAKFFNKYIITEQSRRLKRTSMDQWINTETTADHQYDDWEPVLA